jgi:hypothetical protein
VCCEGCLFSFLCKPSCKMLHYVVIHADASSVSENTIGGTSCVQYYKGCRSEYQYLYNETSVIMIRTLRSLECPLQQTLYRKLSVISRLHSSYNIHLVNYIIIPIPLLLILTLYFYLSQILAKYDMNQKTRS